MSCCIIAPPATDKPKIVFHGAMMAIQNFGFFIMYYDIWGDTPGHATLPVAGVCDRTRLWTGWMAMTCWGVSHLCVGMAFAGFTESNFFFPFYWFFHLIVALGYVLCTLTIPLARFSDDGVACALLNPTNSERLVVVYSVHAAFFFYYVFNMLSVTFFSCGKTYLANRKVGNDVLPFSE